MLQLLIEIAKNIYFLALNVTGAGAFPKPLSAKEEARLLEKVKEGDIAARNRLVEHNLRLVAHIIKKYYKEESERDDLISIGTIGLIKAVSTFKSTKGIRLATYASRCIENEVLMYFRSLKKSSQDVSINDPIDTDKNGNALTLIDVISDKMDIADEIDRQIDLQKLNKILPIVLDKRAMKIIEMRYGLNGSREYTQHEIAEKLSISRSYVSRIEKASIEALRKHFF